MEDDYFFSFDIKNHKNTSLSQHRHATTPSFQHSPYPIKEIMSLFSPPPPSQQPICHKRLSSWRDHITFLSRDELCETLLPSHCVDKDRWFYYNELISAWKSILCRFPTFIIYFRPGKVFSLESFRAFAEALKALEEEALLTDDKPPMISLFLEGLHLGDAEATILASLISSCENLAHLHLKNNSISLSGARDLSDALVDNTTLKLLDLSHNPITEEGAIALAQALSHNSYLASFSIDTEYVTAKAARLFEKMKQYNLGLEELNIWG
jgi:hypothetical protein